MYMRRSIVLMLAVLSMVPSVLIAQSRGKHGPRTVVVRTTSHKSDYWGNRWLLEPYAGLVKDVYDISPDGDNTSVLGGLKVGYLLGARTRLLANFAYSESDNISNPGPLDNFYVYDNTWIFTTGGAEFDVVPGRTSASLGLQAGAAWRRVDLDDQVGSPLGQSEEDSGFSAHDVIIPSVTLRHRVTNRMTVAAGLQDNIFDVFEGPAQHGVAATLGISFR
jgi:hypothetical protein